MKRTEIIKALRSRAKVVLLIASLPTAHYTLHTTHYLSLPTTHYSLHTTILTTILTTHYSLLTAHYPLPTIHYSPPTTHHPPLTIPITRCPLAARMRKAGLF